MKEKLHMRLLWDFGHSNAKHTNLPMPGQEKPRPQRDNCFWTDYVLVKQVNNKHAEVTVPLWWYDHKNDPDTIKIITQRFAPLISAGEFTDFYISKESWLIFIFHLPKNAYFPLVAYRRGMKIITNILGIPKDEVRFLKLQLTPLIKPAGTRKWIQMKDFISSKTKFAGCIQLEE